MVRRCWVNFQCRGVILIWNIVGQGPIALVAGAGGVVWTFFLFIYHFSFLSPSLWETVRYRLTYCLKGPLSPKQPTNQLYYVWFSLLLYSDKKSNPVLSLILSSILFTCIFYLVVFSMCTIGSSLLLKSGKKSNPVRCLILSFYLITSVPFSLHCGLKNFLLLFENPFFYLFSCIPSLSFFLSHYYVGSYLS